MSEVKIYMFRPTEKDLRIEYPELARINEFGELKTKELKFVWYYANRTSPFYTATRGDRTKILSCIRNSFGNSFKDEDSVEYNKYLKGNFPPKIREAIERMERFNPGARVRAKMSIEMVFDNLEKSMFVDEEMEDKMREDIDLRKKYIELSIKVSESMPTIVAQMEEGFGIRTSKSFESGDRAPTMMDMLHMEDD